MSNTGGAKLHRIPGIVGALFCLVLAQPALAEDETKACHQDGQLFAYGDVLAGCTIEAPADLDTFTFIGTAGEHVTIVVAKTAGATLSQPCAVVRDPNNADTVIPCGTRRFDIVGLPASGQYRIFMTEQGNDASVSFNISVERLSPLRGPTSVGPGDVVVGREILPAADLDTFQFTANAGDEVLVIISKTSGATLSQPCAEIRGPDDSVVAPLACGTTNINPGPLPLSGVYQIVVVEQGHDSTVGFNLSLTCLSAECEAAPPTCIVDPSFAGTTLHMDFTVGTPEPARLYVAILAFATTLPLFSHPFPETSPPVAFPVELPDFPAIGSIGLLSTLTTADGISCVDVKTIDTGAPGAVATPETLQRFLTERRP